MIKVIWCWLLKIYVSDRWFPVSYTLRTPGSYPTWPRMNFCPNWTSLFPHLLFPIHWTLNGLLYIWQQVKILEKLLFCVAQHVFWIQLYTAVYWCSLLSVALSQVYCFLPIWCPIYNFKQLFFFHLQFRYDMPSVTIFETTVNSGSSKQAVGWVRLCF